MGRGKYDPVVKARVPIYFVVGEEDKYYSSRPFREVYFSSQGVAYQHAGAGLFSRDKEIMGWLFGY